MRKFLFELRISLIITALLAVLLCGMYPVAILAVAQAFFPSKANGSLVFHDGDIVGSSLLAQAFTGPRYFHPRPSAAGEGYDAAASGGSNLGPVSKKFVENVAQRVGQYRAENVLSPDTPVPADAVTASGSGLDPHISVRNAVLQTPRVAKARGCSESDILQAVRRHTEGRGLWILGEPGVNVLLLNRALDAHGQGEE